MRIEKSERLNKKLKVFYDGKWIHFGDRRYQHYHDKTGIWKELDHNDENRRKKYRLRHEAIVDHNGVPFYLDPKRPAFWSYHILW